MSDYHEIEKMLEEAMEETLKLLEKSTSSEDSSREDLRADNKTYPLEEENTGFHDFELAGPHREVLEIIEELDDDGDAQNDELSGMEMPFGLVSERIKEKVRTYQKLHGNFVLLYKGLGLLQFFERNKTFVLAPVFFPEVKPSLFLTGLISEETFLEVLGFENLEDIFAFKAKISPSVMSEFEDNLFTPESLRSFLKINFRDDCLFPIQMARLCVDISQKLGNFDPMSGLINKAVKNFEGDFIFALSRWIAYIMMLEPARNNHF